MRGKPATAVHEQVERLWREGTAVGLTDGQLLERFVDRRQAMPEEAESAFAAIVDRHGAMVLRTCWKILGEEHEAQDAAQVAFLVLARRARHIRGLGSVGGWLHGVAVRVANKAKVAAIRRRRREDRWAERTAGRTDERARAVADPDRWAELHEELGRLPETLRSPLVLCDLEGATQQQAAAQLGWPLGTVQSRLARGRAKLKSRLIRRGVAPAAGLVGAGGTSGVSQAAAPASWVEATARAAIAFTTRKCWAVRAGAGPASAGLAREVLREMGFTKLKIALAATLVLAVALTSAAALSSPRPKDPLPSPALRSQAGPTPAPRTKPTPTPGTAAWTVRGVVRDARGRPLAKAWVGTDPRTLQDTWDNPRPEDIREIRAVYRDAKGNVIPPGAVGKYFEVREARGQWKPVSPDDIRPWDAVVWGGDGQALPQEEVDKIHSRYAIRTARGGWWMAAIPGEQHPVRTDDEGRFVLTSSAGGPVPPKLHFASPDFTLQAIHAFQPQDFDRPIDVTLRPTRLVHCRVIETPRDDPKASMNWSAYTVDASGKAVAEWQQWFLPNPNAHDPDHVKRHFDVRLPTGRYKIEFRSSTLHRVVDVEVPPGDGPLDFDLVLESLASVRMAGRPATEIEAVDLDGEPVKLADYRGKVVVLDFWATWCGPCIMAMPRLAAIQQRFRDHPVVFLALHDGSLALAGAYRKAAEPLRSHWGGKDLPFRVLLDRPTTPEARRPDLPGPGEKGSGRTAGIYEVMSWPSTFVIAPDGRMVGRFELDDLEGALEDQLGLPRSRPAKAEIADRAFWPSESRNVKVSGRVVGPDGKPVAGAELSPQQVVVRQKGIKTGPDGSFAFTAERILIDHFALRVEAPGLASRMFTLPSTGVAPGPLKLGVGAVVTGRVLRDGRPVPGVRMGLQQIQRGMDEYLGDLTAITDDQGRFRFDHAFVDQELAIGPVTGSLADHGAIAPRVIRTGSDGSAGDLGDLEVRPGRRLAGRVVFADGKAVPARTQVLASCENAPGLIRAGVDARGRFELLGLPEAEVDVSVSFPDIRTWMPAGYRLSPRNRCLDPLNPMRLVGRLDRDVDDLVILFEPGEELRSDYSPGANEDFKQIKRGTIAGAPAGSVPRE